MRKTSDELKRIADRIENQSGDVKRLLWEIQRLAIAKGSHKTIWTLAKRALNELK